MVNLTDLTDSHEVYEEWAGDKDNEDLGLELRSKFLGIARRFLDQGDEALVHWRGQTSIPIQEANGHILIELSCLDSDGKEWVRVR